jgi:D-sedoheptulose 7-phosphate isomerase
MNHSVIDHCKAYSSNLIAVLETQDWNNVEVLAQAIYKAWVDGKNLFLCGNGGSAGNAIHLANDFLYGVGQNLLPGIKVEALSANSAVLTCLANDVGYDEIYSIQLDAKGSSGDILVILSGSGNSPNVVRALEKGQQMGMETYAILGYTGGKCLSLAKVSIHVPIDDMQISEDMQLIVGHICMQWLHKERKASIE